MGESEYLLCPLQILEDKSLRKGPTLTEMAGPLKHLTNENHEDGDVRSFPY